MGIKSLREVFTVGGVHYQRFHCTHKHGDKRADIVTPYLEVD